MLSWLAAWLQQIIAVVLLAGFIDLLLPNKAMQRYVRLIAGLLILLTILTPVIRLLQGDFSTKLDERLSGWLQSGTPSEARMPTLQDIQRDAEALRRKQEASAAALTERKLAEAMRVEIAKRTGFEVREVTVKLEQQAESAGARAVTVTLGDAEPEQEGSSGSSDSKADTHDEQVKPVDPVAVTVTVEPAEDRPDAAGSASAAGDPYIPASRSKSEAVKQVLREGWAIDPGAVTVREAADASGPGSSERRE
jgi:stage III sporulation protein AF